MWWRNASDSDAGLFTFAALVFVMAVMIIGRVLLIPRVLAFVCIAVFVLIKIGKVATELAPFAKNRDESWATWLLGIAVVLVVFAAAIAIGALMRPIWRRIDRRIGRVHPVFGWILLVAFAADVILTYGIASLVGVLACGVVLPWVTHRVGLGDLYESLKLLS